ncbi:MAG: hypothetical protein U0T81_01540 [Saprospiraceae bacterium]
MTFDLSIAGTTKIQGPMDFNFKIRIPRNKLNVGAVGEVAESGLGFLKNSSFQGRCTDGIRLSRQCTDQYEGSAFGSPVSNYLDPMARN